MNRWLSTEGEKWLPLSWIYFWFECQSLAVIVALLSSATLLHALTDSVRMSAAIDIVVGIIAARGLYKVSLLLTTSVFFPSMIGALSSKADALLEKARTWPQGAQDWIKNAPSERLAKTDLMNTPPEIFQVWAEVMDLLVRATREALIRLSVLAGVFRAALAVMFLAALFGSGYHILDLNDPNHFSGSNSPIEFLFFGLSGVAGDALTNIQPVSFFARIICFFQLLCILAIGSLLVPLVFASYDRNRELAKTHQVSPRDVIRNAHTLIRKVAAREEGSAGPSPGLN